MSTLRADLHVHSRHAEKLEAGFLQRLAPTASFTDPEDIRMMAASRGMDFVTITDHDRIDHALQLRDRYPEIAFTGVASTATLPASGCRVNLLIYGFTAEEFVRIDRLRHNVLALRDYLRERSLPHAVAHVVHPAGARLSVDDVEKLILLFDVFEARNGGQGRAGNSTWTRILRRLDPDRLREMSRRHGIIPEGPDPWIKGLIGGSDDHAGVFVGQTWTEAQASDLPSFLEAIRERRTSPGGRHNNYRSMVFATCKLAWDRSRIPPRTADGPGRATRTSGAWRGGLIDGFFERSLDRLRLAAWSKQARMRPERWARLAAEAADGLYARSHEPVEERLDHVYRGIADIADEFVRSLLLSLEQDIRREDLVGAARHLVDSAPGILLALPFFTSIRHLNRGRELMRALLREHGDEAQGRGKRILWFTDTLSDLNGPSTTLTQIGWLAHRHRRDITLVGSLPPDAARDRLPPGLIELPHVYSFRLPVYPDYQMQVPSILRSLETLTELDPDEVYLSTPGPVGLTGLLLARLVGCRCVSVYHSDFPRQVEEIVGEGGALSGLLDSGLRWFYAQADEIAVPTLEYIEILGRRGYDRRRMRLFRRGIDTDHFSPRDEGRLFLEDAFGVRPGVRLLYAGRVSKDKHLDLLVEVFRALAPEMPDLSLVITGDGPYLPEMRERLADQPRAIFTGPLDPKDLPLVYSGSDLLVFPSTTDTFGMAVLEAQSCGTPALVSDVGGPKELIQHGRTGWVLNAGSIGDWVEGIRRAVELLRVHPERFAEMGREARRRVVEQRDWDAVLRAYVDGVGQWDDGGAPDEGARPSPPPSSGTGRVETAVRG